MEVKEITRSQLHKVLSERKKSLLTKGEVEVLDALFSFTYRRGQNLNMFGRTFLLVTAKVVQKARQTRKTVIANLDTLQEKGAIVISGNKSERKYSFNIERITEWPRYAEVAKERRAEEKERHANYMRRYRQKAKQASVNVETRSGFDSSYNVFYGCSQRLDGLATFALVAEPHGEGTPSDDVMPVAGSGSPSLNELEEAWRNEKDPAVRADHRKAFMAARYATATSAQCAADN